MTQLALPLRAQPVEVDPLGAPYRDGFVRGFCAPRNASPPLCLSVEALAGWRDGYAGCRVPLARLPAGPRGW